MIKSLLPDQQTAFSEIAAKLAEVMNRNNEFTVTAAQAKDILATHENPYYVKDHKYMSAETLPVVHDFPAFYVYGEEIHLDLMGRELAEQQSVVWGTGTHTSTPVSVIGYGPKEALKPISGLMHHAELGAVMMDLITE